MATVKAINAKVARLPGVRAFVQQSAEASGVRAATLLAQHHKTGAHRIVVKHRTGRKGLDSMVSIQGPAPGALELGHVARDGSEVEGLHILRRATEG